MAFLDVIRRLLSKGEVPPELSAVGINAEHMKQLRVAFEEEAAKPPRIAVLGETGVGKSWTINALFNAGLEISHERACTEHEKEVIGDRDGPIVIVDLPGIGEDVEADEQHLETYRRVLPTVDMVLWVLKADNRAMTNIQQSLRRLVESKALDPRHLVLGLNQVDLVQPGEWDKDINQPSREQERTILARRKDVVEKVKKVVLLPDDRIVAYSATKFYNLPELMAAMLHACEERRQWLLFERASCADFMTLASPEAKEARP